MKRKTSATVIMYTVLVFFFVIWIFPIYTAITKSLQAGGWDSYLSVINNKDVHYFRVVFNSFFISVVTAVIVVVITSLAGYAFAKMKFTGSQVIYVLLLACMAVPIASVTMPLFFTIKTFGLTNTYLGMIIPLVAFNALQMLLLWRNYFNGVPDEIIEAARVDGCGSLRIWARILMPISTPMIATTGVLTFVYSWNEYLIPLLLQVSGHAGLHLLHGDPQPDAGDGGPGIRRPDSDDDSVHHRLPDQPEVAAVRHHRRRRQELR